MTKKKKKAHYVNNKEFSQAVVDYCTKVKEARESGNEIPIVPDYIATCFLNIAEGLSHRDNFIRYTYREEMVMDAVENCLKAIENYNVEAATRSGNPNAFAYFTQIAWYAFVRRITKENKQQDIKMKYMSQAGIDTLAIVNDADPAAQQIVQSFVDSLKDRMDKVKEKDAAFYEFKKAEKKATRLKDSDNSLEKFIE